MGADWIGIAQPVLAGQDRLGPDRKRMAWQRVAGVERPGLAGAGQERMRVAGRDRPRQDRISIVWIGSAGMAQIGSA